MVGGAGVGEPGPSLGNGPAAGGGGRGVTDTASLAGPAPMASFSSLSSSSLSLAALVGETVMTPSGQANVIYLAVNESSPGSLLLQLCELLATTPLQVYTVNSYSTHVIHLCHKFLRTLLTATSRDALQFFQYEISKHFCLHG